MSHSHGAQTRIHVRIESSSVALSRGLTALLETATDVAVRSRGSAPPRDDGLPEVVITDDLARAQGEQPDLTVYLVATADDPSIVSAIAAGINNIVLTSVGDVELSRAVHSAAAGGATLPLESLPQVFAALRTATSPRILTPIDGGDAITLSDREVSVITGIARGLTNAEIAGEIGRQSGTVKSHLARIMRKVRANSRAELIVWAMRAGVLE